MDRLPDTVRQLIAEFVPIGVWATTSKAATSAAIQRGAGISPRRYVSLLSHPIGLSLARLEPPPLVWIQDVLQAILDHAESPSVSCGRREIQAAEDLVEVLRSRFTPQEFIDAARFATRGRRAVTLPRLFLMRFTPVDVNHMCSLLHSVDMGVEGDEALLAIASAVASADEETVPPMLRAIARRPARKRSLPCTARALAIHLSFFPQEEGMHHAAVTARAAKSIMLRVMKEGHDGYGNVLAALSAIPGAPEMSWIQSCIQRYAR